MGRANSGSTGKGKPTKKNKKNKVFSKKELEKLLKEIREHSLGG